MSAASVVTAPTVLVVDDNAAKRYITVRWLQKAGYEIMEATSGHEALTLARTQPDLMVLDVKLPDISGFEVCRRIKAATSTAHIPVLHLSAHINNPEARVTGLEGGADAYLAHPVDSEELVATVRALLRIRRTEAALRASEERYRLVARATNDVIWDWDLRSGEILWNDAAGNLFRRARDEIGPTAQWWYDQIHPDDRGRVVAGLRAVIDGAGETWLDEYRMLRGDGTYATVYDRGFVAHDDRGQPTRMIGSMLDITDRRRGEETQELLAAVSSDLAQTLDPEASLAHFAGFVLGRFADLCVVYTPDARGAMTVAEFAATAAVDPTRRAAAALPETVARAEVVSRTGTSERLDAREESLQIHQAHGSHDPANGAGQLLRTFGLSSALLVPLTCGDACLGTVLFGRLDASPRYTERDLATAEELAGRAATATHNARLYESERIASRAKSDFLAVMSHELRTPLNAVLGYSDLLLLGVAGQLPGQSADYLGRIQLAARHLLQLIEQILTYSRMETGREQVHAEHVKVCALARDMAALIEPLAQEKGLSFHLECASGDDVEIVTDAAKTRQIVLNLLSNAIKFTARGEVRLEVSADDGAVCFAVADTGIGIAPEHLPRVFDPFWQVEQRTTRTAGGSGLGLTVSRRLARLMGGDIVVASTRGEGSLFTLRLPRGTGDGPSRMAVAPPFGRTAEGRG